MVNKVKIGIISEFSTTTTNFGNNVQAYALNKYIREVYPEHQVETIYFKNEFKMKRTFYIGSVIRKCKVIIKRLRKNRKDQRKDQRIDNTLIVQRENAFNKFVQKNISLCPEPMDWELLNKSDYDLFIVGSDVVWMQSHFCINRIKFLDFKNIKCAQKASYAASFGRDWIPRENRKWIKKYLSDFLGISVRENSSVELLNSIGIPNVLHTLDPTLLINADEWSRLEIRLDKIPDGPFAFVYLLGMDTEQRKQITGLCRKEKLTIVTVAFAYEIENDVDKSFGDVCIWDCALEEWIWLMHHAELIITDSFHGTVFSTIFKKKFLVVRRELHIDINNRIDDYLRTICQIDKKVDLSKMDSLSGKIWDYTQIFSLILEKKNNSIKYIDEIIRKAKKMDKDIEKEETK